MMFVVYFFILLVNLSFAFTPSCSTCKFFIPHETIPDNNLGFCNMFQDNINGKLIKNLAIHCRNDENLCGKSGFLYEPIENKVHVTKNDDTK